MLQLFDNFKPSGVYYLAYINVFEPKITNITDDSATMGINEFPLSLERIQAIKECSEPQNVK